MVGMDVVSRSPILKGILQGEAEAKPRPDSRKWKSCVVAGVTGHYLCYGSLLLLALLRDCGWAWVFASHAELLPSVDIYD